MKRLLEAVKVWQAERARERCVEKHRFEHVLIAEGIVVDRLRCTQCGIEHTRLKKSGSYL